MPQVPTLQNQVRPQSAPNVQQRPLQSSFAQDVGQGVSNLGSTVAKVQQQERAKADQAAFMEADRNTDALSNDLITRAQRSQLKDAIGSAPKLLAEFDQKSGEIEFGLKNERQKTAYRQAVSQHRLQLNRTLESHEGAETERYYAAERDAYKTQARVNAVTNYQDPGRIEREVDKVRSVLDNTPGLDSAMREAELGARRSDIYSGVIDRYLANDQIKQAESYYASIKDRLGDKAARVENSLIDAKARVTAAQKTALTTSRANRILTLYASDGPEVGSAALSQLAKQLPPDVMGEVYSKVQTSLGHARNAKQEEHADVLAKLQQNISGGVAGPEDMATVEALWKDNAFSPTERASLVGRIEASQVAHAGSMAAAAVIRDSLASGVPLDPSNSEQKKALAAAFGEDSRETQVGSPQWQGLAVAYAARTRVLPDQATAWVRSAIRSPDPKIAAPAAQFLGSVEATAGDASSGFDPSTKAFAGMVNSMMEAGTSGEKAIEIARSTVYEQKPALIKQRKAEYSEGKTAFAASSNNALNDFIDRDMDPGILSRPPAATAALQVDFNSQAQNYYLMTGDIALSRALAWKDVTRVYGPSEVNGVRQVMAAPPERFGVKPEDVRADIAAFLASSPQAEGATPDDIILVPDAITLRATASIMDGQPQQPTYKLLNGKTNDLVLDKQGVPMRYALPSNEDLTARLKEEKDKATEVATQQVKQARFDRDTRARRRELFPEGVR
jgi:hypothetical protein